MIKVRQVKVILPMKYIARVLMLKVTATSWLYWQRGPSLSSPR